MSVFANGYYDIVCSGRRCYGYRNNTCAPLQEYLRILHLAIAYGFYIGKRSTRDAMERSSVCPGYR